MVVCVCIVLLEAVFAGYIIMINKQRHTQELKHFVDWKYIWYNLIHLLEYLLSFCKRLCFHLSVTGKTLWFIGFEIIVLHLS